MDEIESRTPLAAAPQAQYFDVSDVESTSSEEAAPPPATAQAHSEDDEGELEVFHAEDSIKPSFPEPERDPFGIEAMGSEGAGVAPPPVPLALPAATFFEGQGIQTASAKAAADDFDDEFDYAFEGQAREGETHKQVFNADSIPVPKGLLTDVNSGQLGSLCEGDEGEEEEEQPAAMSGKGMQEQGGSGDVEESEWESATRRVQDELTEGSAGAAVLELRPAMQSFEVESPSEFPSWTPPTNDNSALMATITATDHQGTNLAVDLDEIDLWGENGATPTRHEASFDVTPRPEIRPGAEDLDAQWTEASEQALASEKSKGDSTKRSSKYEAGHDKALYSEMAVMPPEQKQRSLITTQKALKYFAALDVGQYFSEIVEQDGSGPAGPAWLSRLLCGMLGPPQLKSPVLAEERKRVFCYAKIAFSDSESMHFRILSSIYMRFVSGPAPSRYGAHWADIGFQGNDPATDLRGCGMLGLVQLLHLWDADSGNAAAIYRLSRSQMQEFPLAVVAMNITKWCLQALRAGKLNAFANSKGCVFTAAMQFYVGVFYYFFDTWLDRKATMSESGYVLKDVEAHCKKRPADMLKLAKSSHLENRA